MSCTGESAAGKICTSDEFPRGFFEYRFQAPVIRLVKDALVHARIDGSMRMIANFRMLDFCLLTHNLKQSLHGHLFACMTRPVRFRTIKKIPTFRETRKPVIYEWARCWWRTYPKV